MGVRLLLSVNGQNGSILHSKREYRKDYLRLSFYEGWRLGVPTDSYGKNYWSPRFCYLFKQVEF